MADARAIFADNSHAKNPDRAEPAAIAIRRRRSTVPDGLAFPDDQRASMLELDGEEHARVRNPLVQALYAHIARFEPECLRIVDAALGRLDGRADFDLMRELAEPVPVACIGSILGVPQETLATFRGWLNGIVQTFNPNRTPENVAALVAASNGLAHYIRGRFEDAKRNPPDDLFGDMARAQMAGAPLARMEAKHLLSRLFMRLPKLRLAEPDAPPAWRRLPGFRGLEALSLRAD
jgi:cytochrome P450